MTDIEQMFHSFIVREDHRDFLRFFWHRNNNPNEEAVEYRMKVHLFATTATNLMSTVKRQVTCAHCSDRLQRQIVWCEFELKYSLKINWLNFVCDVLQRQNSVVAAKFSIKFSCSHEEIVAATCCCHVLLPRVAAICRLVCFGLTALQPHSTMHSTNTRKYPGPGYIMHRCYLYITVVSKFNSSCCNYNT